MISPISLAFQKCKKESRPALLTYTVAGDNTKKKSLEILKSISEHADILEIGFPHNAPTADGPQIQNSSCHPCQEDMTVIKTSPKQTNAQFVLKSYVDFDCTQEWTAFVVPFRKREEHLPHFMEAISKLVALTLCV